ncbi:hypothetical protein [Bdellovibrio bacteriovorus]|uniref:hypothetical protein n=1 Tax=Bdellovibrio bacteriovorus TaxID=959 RepID=UPI0035A87D09
MEHQTEKALLESRINIKIFNMRCTLIVSYVALITSFFISGCAYMRPVERPEALSLSNYQCIPKNLRVGFEVPPRHFGLYKMDELDLLKNPSTKELDEPANVLAMELERHGVAKLVSKDEQGVLGLTLYRREDSHFIPLLSAVSLGIIPTKTTGEVWMEAEYFNSKGERRGIYQSSKIKFEIYIGWFFVPWRPEKAISDKEFYSLNIPILMKDIVKQISNDNLLDCRFSL